MEARFFRFAVVIALCTFIGWIAAAVANYRQLDDYRTQAGELRDQTHKVEAICARMDIPDKDRRTMCDYLPTAKAQQLAVESNVIEYQKNYSILATWAFAFPAAVMALFYALRWIVTGRMRPFAPG